jgi:hypothetical protein
VNNVPFIKIEKKTNGKIEQAKVLIRIFCELSDIKLSKTELSVLAYFIVYKITPATQELILKAKILASADSLRNTMTKLRKFELIKKLNKEDVLHPSLNVNLEPVMGILIKVDNK